MQTVVRTRQGAVEGSAADGVVAFKGISYAAPPFGPNRFQPPQPVEPWQGVRPALNYGPTAPKAPYFPPFDVLLPEVTIPGEDCLNLNIWTPDLGSARLPVMVWIHGGAFLNGSGSWLTYDGTRFARDGIVCVTINYRLGADGFLYLGDGNANLGMLDQIAALMWVQENIAAFGGDPNNVTVFGESAGGMSVAALLAMPAAAGLFRRGIAQSGAGHHVYTAETAERVGRILAEKLGVEPTREAIASVPINRLVQAQQELRVEMSRNPDPERWGEAAVNGVPFLPVIDGETLPERPVDAMAAGAGANIDVLVGTNADEFRLYMVPQGTIHAVNEQRLSAAIAGYGLPVAETLATYCAARPDATPGELLVAIITDWFFRIPAIRMAEVHAQQHAAGTYMYEFAWNPPTFDGKLGACHALDVPFIFDNLDKKGFEGLMGTNPPQQVADAMHTAWVGFATNGNPGWPQYEPSRRATMRFDVTSEVVEDPGSAERVLWEGRR
ncbi:MAG TPA: carboxylesterase/lipase family protein [Ktedonobacteraceae bacterium]|jgi:para-nitrobenzyl esterase|nr:carboxylesterase/lipase family protein [Ktedonobacteraceae bacterium]